MPPFTQTAEPPTLSESVTAVSAKIYRVGTLSYTFRGLAMVFIWMLFGDFCFSMMEAVIPKLLPLTLKDLNASNATIGLLVGTIASVMNMIITPIVSYRSDRHRGKWGRRIPYLVWPSPFIAICLIAVGFSHDIGGWIHRLIISYGGTASFSTVTIVTIGVASAMFQFFNMFVASIYYYLFNDVVPEQYLGRFYALFRVVGAASGAVFSRYVLPYAGEEHSRKWIYVVVALIYLVSFMLMCWRVKEGEYPPPEPVSSADDSWWQRLLKAVQVYFRECYSLRFYWWFYLGTAFYTVGLLSLLTFRVFFAKDVGVELDQFGKVESVVFLMGVFLYWPLGWLADKIHSLRLIIVAIALTSVVVFVSSVTIHHAMSYWVYTLCWAVAWLAYSASNAPLFPQILPKDQFGQFASAQAIFNSIATMIASYVGGVFLDFVGSISRANQYRAIYWWAGTFSTLSLICMLMLYRGWKQLGGDKGYVAPTIAPAAVQGFPVSLTDH